MTCYCNLSDDSCSAPGANSSVGSGTCVGHKANPFCGWEWLRTPGLLIMMIGAMGIFHAYAERTGVLPDSLRFPHLSSCWAMVTGGVILVCISIAARKGRGEQQLPSMKKRKSWRSL